MEVLKVLGVRRYKAGYEVRTERVGHDGNPPLTWKMAYTPTGDYIGEPRFAYRLCAKRGIKPEKTDPSHNVCSIGLSEQEQKWYGWSHRAIFGFSIGSMVQEGDCCASSGWVDEYLAEHPEADRSLPVGFTAHSLEDAKRMAIAFSESVS